MKVLYTHLPDEVKSYLKEDTPVELRLKAAKGIFPLSPSSQIALLLYLLHDTHSDVKKTSADTISKLPSDVLEEGVKTLAEPVFIEEVYEHIKSHRIHILLIHNPAVPESVLRKMVKSDNAELLNELSFNVELLKKHPQVVPDLISNPRLDIGRKEYLKEIFNLAEKEEGFTEKEGEFIGDESETVETPEEPQSEEKEEVKKMIEALTSQNQSDSQETRESERTLLKRLHTLTVSQKIKLAMVGPSSIRKVLLRDSNRQVALAALRSPKTTDSEAEELAKSRNVSEEILREIANNRVWMKNYRIRLALVQNPKTPLSISMKLLRTLNEKDIKHIAKDKNVPTALVSMAKGILKEK